MIIGAVRLCRCYFWLFRHSRCAVLSTPLSCRFPVDRVMIVVGSVVAQHKSAMA